MKYLKKFENYNNDLSHEITYSLIDLLDEYSVTEIMEQSSDNYPTDGFLYTYIHKRPDDTGRFHAPKAFHRNCSKNGINYIVLYSNGYPGLKFQEIVNKSIERLNRLYDVKITKNNENSSTIIVNQDTGRDELIIPCRIWIIEIYEKSQLEGLSNRTCDRCGKQTNVMSMSWLNTDECCIDCLEAEKDEPDYILAKQKEAEQVRKGNFNYGGWRNESYTNSKMFESGQVFDYESKKDQIINYIKSVKKGEEPFMPVNMFYGLIRGESKIDTANKLGFTDDEKKKWKSSLQSSPWNSDGVWSQIDYNPHLKEEERRKTGKHIDYNYYVTLKKDKENIIKFGKSLNDLNQKLYKLSKEKNTAISFKTHTLLDCICGDNDSLKVYYYNFNLKDEIERTVISWIKSNNILTSLRTHTHGVDVKKGNEDKKSWGIIISTIIDEQFRKTISQYGNKYTNEQYYEWFKKWFPNMIQKIKIEYK